MEEGKGKPQKMGKTWLLSLYSIVDFLFFFFPACLPLLGSHLAPVNRMRGKREGEGKNKLVFSFCFIAFEKNGLKK